MQGEISVELLGREIFSDRNQGGLRRVFSEEVNEFFSKVEGR
jgi:hypothetical protein